MANRIPLVINSGQVEQLQPGDSISASSVSGNYGEMYIPSGTVKSVSMSGSSSFSPVNGSFSGGSLNEFVFQSAYQLVCEVTGVYVVNWSMTIAPGSSVPYIGGFAVNGSAQTNGRAIYQSGTTTESISASAIVSLNSTDIVTLVVASQTNPSTVNIGPATITIYQI